MNELLEAVKILRTEFKHKRICFFCPSTVQHIFDSGLHCADGVWEERLYFSNFFECLNLVFCAMHAGQRLEEKMLSTLYQGHIEVRLWLVSTFIYHHQLKWSFRLTGSAISQRKSQNRKMPSYIFVALVCLHHLYSAQQANTSFGIVQEISWDDFSSSFEMKCTQILIRSRKLPLECSWGKNVENAYSLT